MRRSGNLFLLESEKYGTLPMPPWLSFFHATKQDGRDHHCILLFHPAWEDAPMRRNSEHCSRKLFNICQDQHEPCSIFLSARVSCWIGTGFSCNLVLLKNGGLGCVCLCESFVMTSDPMGIQLDKPRISHLFVEMG